MKRSAVADEFTAAFHGVDGLVTIPLEPNLSLDVYAIVRGADASNAAIELFNKEMTLLLNEWSELAS